MIRMLVNGEWKDVDENTVLTFRAKAGGLRLTITPSVSRVTNTGQTVSEEGQRVFFTPLSPVRWLKIGPGTKADNRLNSWLRGKYTVLRDQKVITGITTIEKTEDFLLKHPNYWKNVLKKDPKAQPSSPNVHFMTEDDWDEWEIEEHKRVQAIEAEYIKQKEAIRQQSITRRSALKALHKKTSSGKGDSNVETNSTVPGDEASSII